MALRNLRTGLVVAATLEPAFDSTSRKRGLLGRDGLPESHALIIAPSNMVHTFFMRFPIDILIVSRSGLVVKAVVEMRAGSLTGSGTRTGDTLSLAESSTDSTLKVSS